MVRVRAFAKLNLCLEVLNKRPDGFHNIRTIFQTISLHDTIGIDWKRSRTTRITLTSNVEIPGENLIVRAAHGLLEAVGTTATIHFDLQKRIPMGGGLGGGSTDAAAVLMALPVLLRKPVSVDRLVTLGASLGSDIPFFFMGGTAVGLGRGTELYPLPDALALSGLLIDPALHVSTPAAYKSLQRTEEIPEGPAVSQVESMGYSVAAGVPWGSHAVNHFEDAVFAQHPVLGELKNRLAKTGAVPALMTGSGAALFGVFSTEEKRDKAADKLSAEIAVHRFSFLPRKRYQSAWARLRVA